MDLINRYIVATGANQQLPKEQQAILDTYREKQQEFLRAAKEIRSQLKKELNFLNNRIRMINIVYIPLFVALLGIVWAVRRRFPRRKSKS